MEFLLGFFVLVGILAPTSTEYIPMLDIYPRPKTIFISKITLPESMYTRARDDIAWYEIDAGDNIFIRKGTSPVTIGIKRIEQKAVDRTTLAYAEVYSWKCDITLDDKWWTDHELKFVLLHELGHCYGYGHDPIPGRVMSEFYTPGLSYANEMEFLHHLTPRASLKTPVAPIDYIPEAPDKHLHKGHFEPYTTAPSPQ